MKEHIILVTHCIVNIIDCWGLPVMVSLYLVSAAKNYDQNHVLRKFTRSYLSPGYIYRHFYWYGQAMSKTDMLINYKAFSQLLGETYLI